MTLALGFQGQICDLPYLRQKWKANISIELKASMPIEFDLGHDFERWGVRIYGNRIVTGWLQMSARPIN